MSTDTPTPKVSLVDHYNFDLPKELIAQTPLPNREDARLLHASRADGELQHGHVRDFDQLLQENDCLVLNNSRVLPAKLVGVRTLTGGRWQGLFLDADQNGNWRVLCKTRGNAKPGESISLADRDGTHRFSLELVTRLDDGSWVVHPEPEGTCLENLKKIGHVPLPNYIRGGNMMDSDVKDYQTIYAKHAGSIAAPTAGLHLTEALLRRIIDRGVKIAQVTLHIGIGTIRPIKTPDINAHEMHAERGCIDQKAVDLISSCRSKGGRIVAVGTTSARVLETASSNGELNAWEGETDLFIRPPHQFESVDALLTNFHSPRSTLLVLAHAFGGDQFISKAYEAAIEEKYRFYNYGDAMLIT